MKLCEPADFFDKSCSKEELGPNRSQPAIGIEIKCNKMFYSAAKVDWPLTLIRSTPYVGTTSATRRIVIERESRVLCEVFITGVLVDSISWKPVPFPQVMHDHYQQVGNGPKPELLQRFVLPPAGQYHSWKFKVAHSDMDVYQHATMSAYIRFCMDGAADAAMFGFLRNVQGASSLWTVSYVKGEFVSENVAGDELDVCVWDHPSDTNALLFLIFNHDKKSPLTFRCMIRFHEVQSKL